MQKLLLAMTGQSFVQVSQQDLDDESSKNLVRDFLRLGKFYAEIQNTTLAMRVRTDHDRMSEACVQAVEQVLDSYIQVLLTAENEAIHGRLNLLKLRYLVAPYLRGLPEVANMLRKIKSSFQVLRLAGELQYSLSPISSEMVQTLIRRGLDVLRSSLQVWLSQGKIQPGSEAFSLFVDLGPRLLLRRGKVNEMRDSLFELRRFKLILDRVPIDLRLSLDWAAKLLMIGKYQHILKGERSGISPPGRNANLVDVFDEATIAEIFRETDSELCQIFNHHVERCLKLVRDIFFVGRGEVFRAAMDLKGDFEQACRAVNAEHIFEEVSLLEASNKLNSLVDSVLMVDATWQSLDSEFSFRRAKSFIVFTEKVSSDENFALSMANCQLLHPEASSLWLCAASTFHYFEDDTMMPELCLQITSAKCVLYLDGIFVQEESFPSLALVINEVVLKYNAYEGRIIVNVSYEEKGKQVVLEMVHQFADALISPKWLDCFGRSFLGVINATGKTKLGTISYERVPQESLGAPSGRLRFVLNHPSTQLFAFDMYENLNGGFWFLFRVKTAQELLTRAWTVIKKDRSLDFFRSKLAFFLHQVYVFFQWNVVESGIGGLRLQIKRGMSSFEALQQFTEEGLELIGWRCGLNNRVLMKTLEDLASRCEDWALKMIKSPTELRTREVEREFDDSLEHLLTLLNASQSQLSNDLRQQLEPMAAFGHRNIQVA